MISKTTSGGTCINDTVIHIGNHNLHFVGVGSSGMGKDHGDESILAFSNKRVVITSPTWIDLPFRYVPFKYFYFLKKMVRMVITKEIFKRSNYDQKRFLESNYKFYLCIFKSYHERGAGK